jgi:hypothetical protein
MITSFLNFKENTTNKIQLGLIVLFSFGCLLPLFLGVTSHVEETPLRGALSSSTYRDSAIAMISLAIPLLMDTIADAINSFFRKEHNESIVQLEKGFVFMNDNERMLYMFGLLILPITALFPQDTINLGLIHVCCSSYQFMVCTGLVFASLNRYDKKFWSTRTTYLCICLMGFGTISQTFVLNLKVDGPDSKGVANIYQASSICYFATALIFYICTARWFFVVILSFCRRQFNIDNKDEERKNIFFPLLFILTILSALSFIIAVWVVYRTITARDSIGIVINTLPYILSLLFVSFVTLRMIKFEVVQGLVS